MWNSAARDLVDQSLEAGNTVCFTVPTGSMSPFLAPGEKVIVESAKASEIKVGDIIVWKTQIAVEAQSAWIVHRLIERRIVNGSWRLVTKGDNAPFADKPLSENQLCGVVTVIQRRDSKRVVRILSRRARWIGSILAMLSRAQSFVQTKMNGMSRRIFAKALRVVGHCFGKLAREMVG